MLYTRPIAVTSGSYAFHSSYRRDKWFLIIHLYIQAPV